MTLDANRFKAAQVAGGQQFQFHDAMDDLDHRSREPVDHGDDLRHFNPEKQPEDVEAWPGGPLTSQIDSWKKQFKGKVFITQLDPEDFHTWYVWHSLQRLVYKQILAIPSTDPLQREELICEACVLWPMNFDHHMQAGGDAGIPAVLAEQIMEKSGFTRAAQPRQL